MTQMTMLRSIAGLALAAGLRADFTRCVIPAADEDRGESDPDRSSKQCSSGHEKILPRCKAKVQALRARQLMERGF